MSRPSSCLSRVAAFVAAAVMTLLVVPHAVQLSNAAAVSDFAKQYRALMESAGTGFSMMYHDMTAPPTSYQWGCTTGSSTTYSVAYASATAPYAVSVGASAVSVTRTSATSGVSYNLLGLACSTDATCGSVQTGSTLSFTLSSNQIIMVGGTITSNSVVNFLPVAYYVVQAASACLSSVANVTTAFGTGASPVWTQLWA